MNRSGAYDIMEKAYVTGGDEVTVTALAREHGRSKSTVARMARIQGWYDKRASYRDSLANRTYEATADEYGPRIVKLNERFLTAAEKTVERYIEAVESREITPAATDLAKIMTVVREITAKPSEEGPEGTGDIRIPEGVGIEAIRALEQLARDRIAGVSGTAPPRPQLASTG